MTITYKLEPNLSPLDFQTVLRTSTLAPRRPTNDLHRLALMLKNSTVIITARDDKQIIGIARAISDRAFATYLSDLAVDEAYQGQGIGRQLIQEVHKSAGLETTLFLVSAPAAETYYPAIGMTHVPSCWKFPAPK